jgi:hypothetical protein
MVMSTTGLYLCGCVVVVVVVGVFSGVGVPEVCWQVVVGRRVMGVGEATGVVREIWKVVFEIADADDVVGEGRVVLRWIWADVRVVQRKSEMREKRMVVGWLVGLVGWSVGWLISRGLVGWLVLVDWLMVARLTGW